MGQYSIKDLEVLSGIKAHTLRIWEQRYKIVEPKRTNTNIRYYTDEQLKTILNVSVLNGSGRKISKIASLTSTEIAHEVLAMNQEHLNEGVYINQLVEGMICLDKKLILNILQKSENFDTLTDFFLKVVFPFLARVGMLWSSNSINPGQEHFASNIIKRFLLNKIESLNEPHSDAPMFLLFLPEGDWHELSLLVAEYILKNNGNRVLYLGASVPDSDVKAILSLTKIDYLLCVSILSQPLESIQNTINRIAELSHPVALMFAGRAFYHPDLKFPKEARIVYSFEDLGAS
tara:strand:+ start:192 stop:1058 length:867 start_codon:yes stop_codon:yes gene_type:complete